MGVDMRILGVAIVGAVLMTGGSLKVSGGQIQNPPWNSKTGQQMPGMPKPGINNPADPDPIDPHRAEQQEKLRNNDRQKRLVADTDKLLALATDLKAQVDKTDKEILSVDVIKKAEEIEKLAHSVKERMKG
jgi:hypothetical protein